MASSDIKLPMSEVADRLTMHATITVTGIKWFAFRCWLGCKFIKAGALIIGCGIVIEEKPCKPEA